ncbi:MAG: Rpn family recombination-promoting nuclease/putative transposase [Sphaerochaetaceae bacterium]|nr:Rpn family recombination-promoting nuclease/putative transposase [Candidatus Cloacimonadota bacterium]MDD2232854.1 Rpn family recombination-promoting nuclease/putative transposase [Sphaerochaetaceae bacterium]
MEEKRMEHNPTLKEARIDPLWDRAFMTILDGPEESTNMMIGDLVNAVVERFDQEKAVISSVTAQKMIPGEIPDSRWFCLDVMAEADGTVFDIEVQLIAEEHFAKRLLAYSGRSQLNLMRMGMKYADIPRSRVIALCRFNPGLELDENQYMAGFTLRNAEDGGKDHQKLRENLLIVLVDLPKARKVFERKSLHGEKSGVLLSWLYMLEAGLKEDTMITAEEYLSMSDGIKEFQKRYGMKTVTRELVNTYLLEEENRRMKEDCLLYATNRGIEKGMKKGIEKGIEKGQSMIVRNLNKSGMSFSEIVRMTGCSEQEVREYLK